MPYYKPQNTVEGNNLQSGTISGSNQFHDFNSTKFSVTQNHLYCLRWKDSLCLHFCWRSYMNKCWVFSILFFYWPKSNSSSAGPALSTHPTSNPLQWYCRHQQPQFPCQLCRGEHRAEQETWGHAAHQSQLSPLLPTHWQKLYVIPRDLIHDNAMKHLWAWF